MSRDTHIRTGTDEPTAAGARFRLGGRWVGEGCPVYVIAEAGVNHNGDVARARAMIDVARQAGADAVKFQTFRTEAIATRDAPKAGYHIETTGSDKELSWFDLLKSQELGDEAHEELARHAASQGIDFLSTPYDTVSADLLDRLGVPAFKVASTDLNNVPLLRHIASKGRPVLLSTAMSHLEEVRTSVEVLRAAGCRNLVVLQCTGSYPTTLDASNVRALVTMRERLGVLTGFSDHSMEPVNPVLAVALGAVVFEKHFTLDRSLPGPDHRMSLTPDELRRTVDLIRGAEQALGDGDKRVLPAEEANRARLRKSLVAAADLAAGTRIDAASLAVKRPGTGLPPSMYDAVLGRVVRREIAADEVLREEDLQ